MRRVFHVKHSYVRGGTRGEPYNGARNLDERKCLMEREVAWKKYDDAQLSAVDRLAADYIGFIS